MEDRTVPQLDYKKYDLLYPNYQFSKTLPVSGGNSWDISAAGQEIIIELPIKAYNLARSWLYFQIASLDTNARIANGLQQWMPADSMGLIRNIQLYTRTNTYVCDLTEVQNYTAVVWKAETKLQDYLTYDQGLNNGAGSVTIPQFNNNGYARFTQPSYLNLPGLANRRHDNSPSQLTGYEPLHYYATNAVTNNAGAGSLVLNCQIPLAAFFNTILAMDKDLYFNEVMQLRIVLNGTNRFLYTTPAAAGLTDPSGGGAAAVPTYNVNISNFMLYLAVEQNINVENQLRAKVMTGEGFSMLIPYVCSSKNGYPPSSSQTVSNRYNRGHGIRLKKIYYAPFNAIEQLNTAYDHSNLSPTGVAGAKINNFYTQIDNTRLQQYNVDCTNLSGQSQDYLQMQQLLRGSIITTSNIYQYNWLWCDDFTWVRRVGEKGWNDIPEDNILQGLDLTEEKKWDLIATTANVGLIHYVFAITEKLMTINANGINVA